MRRYEGRKNRARSLFKRLRRWRGSHDMTKTSEFASLLESAGDLSILHSPNIPYRSSNVVVRHQRFHYLEWGAPDAQPILLLHGGHQSAHSWDLVSCTLRKNTESSRLISAVTAIVSGRGTVIIRTSQWHKTHSLCERDRAAESHRHGAFNGRPEHLAHDPYEP